jgi:hypothetical protein
MARAHVHYHEQPNRVILTYHLPTAQFSLSAGFWCLVGGLAVGIGIAVPLTAAGIIGDGTPTLGQALAAITVISTVALYLVGYAGRRRSGYLRIIFDYARRVLDVEPTYAGQRRVRYAFDEIDTFELVDRSTRWQTGCALILVRRGISQPETLLALPRACNDERSGLPHFLTRLEAQLEANPFALDDDLPPTPLYAPRPVPARRWQPVEPEPLDFPDDDDDDDQQLAE